ncbi:MAG: glycerol-3-phosphate 1-O-acyltransferase PlsY [Lactobacillales bacterium]|jgi:glycerol-3-phosphate acyltransferase PlsY|nr:glycerol-3-phosphate 1-O-acyltransferase PlsY [Lactobacillales bacterium]
MLTAFICALIGYFFGSIPYGLVFTKMAGLPDIRTIGSGNIGATNVLRTGRKDLALLTLIFDLSKAALAALICEYFWDSNNMGLIAGFFAVIGHNYPVWLNFKGGKGVASTLGMILATTPIVGLISVLLWLAMALIFRYSSLAALTALTAAPICALVLGHEEAALCYALLALLSGFRHKENINRLMTCGETKISFKRKKNDA